MTDLPAYTEPRSFAIRAAISKAEVDQIRIAAITKGMKFPDAVAEALRDWLAKQPA